MCAVTTYLADHLCGLTSTLLSEQGRNLRKGEITRHTGTDSAVALYFSASPAVSSLNCKISRDKKISVLASSDPNVMFQSKTAQINILNMPLKELGRG